MSSISHIIKAINKRSEKSFRRYISSNTAMHNLRGISQNFDVKDGSQRTRILPVLLESNYE